jgi:O-antigen ligase
VNLATATTTIRELKQTGREKSTAGFFWLTAFYVVYCIRPEDWLLVLGVVPLAKITGLGAFLALLFSSSKGQRKFRDLPIESYYLLALIGVLFVSAALSPVWKGGAVSRTLDFCKVYIVWLLTFFLLTDLPKFRRIIFIQAASVWLISILSIVKGHSRARLDGVLGGIYSNPNDLAFAIVLSLPFCFMFLLTARSALRKLLWVVGMLGMAAALFMTASRGGFITLIITGIVCLWHFAVKGKRFYLIVASALVLVTLMIFAGGSLRDRMTTLFTEDDLETRQERSAAGSFEERKYLVDRAIEGVEQYPLLGMGARNFETYSGRWHEVHMTYLQIAAEGGIPCLILYLLFFARGFRNLRRVAKRKDLDREMRLFTAAIHSSLVGFVVGACFAPEAYVYFPYFAVAYTTVLLALVEERQQPTTVAAPLRPMSPVYASPAGAVVRP